jgi:hypothetical protein
MNGASALKKAFNLAGIKPMTRMGPKATAGPRLISANHGGEAGNKPWRNTMQFQDAISNLTGRCFCAKVTALTAITPVPI